jgi:hypothetical protein
MFTARYALSPYIKQIRFVFKGLRYRPDTFLELKKPIKNLRIASLGQGMNPELPHTNQVELAT